MNARQPIQRALLWWALLWLLFPFALGLENVGPCTAGNVFFAPLLVPLIPGYLIALPLKPLAAHTYLHVPHEEQYLSVLAVYVSQLVFMVFAFSLLAALRSRGQAQRPTLPGPS